MIEREKAEAEKELWKHVEEVKALGRGISKGWENTCFFRVTHGVALRPKEVAI